MHDAPVEALRTGRPLVRGDGSRPDEGTDDNKLDPGSLAAALRTTAT